MYQQYQIPVAEKILYTLHHLKARTRISEFLDEVREEFNEQRRTSKRTIQLFEYKHRSTGKIIFMSQSDAGRCGPDWIGVLQN